jgi:cellulose synthase/poly-beta-1,6-N-acetylglucosamine synthase-like glycosyltransferase
MRVIFWLSAVLVAYVYAGYPLLLALVSRWRRSTTLDETHRPEVSLVIAAHNEEKVLREKLENSLALGYPRERLQIVVVSDGSEDGTAALAREYADRGVILLDVWPRGGKTRALNLAVPQTTGEVLVLSDANTMYRPDAIARLVRHFADPAVGAVSGDVRLVDSAQAYAASEGLYYRYERWLQRLESRLGSIVGADGGMYALRRSLYAAVPASVVVDDFVISMEVARRGARVIYDPEAIALEQGTLSATEEFRRKVRIVAGGIQALLAGHGVPSMRRPLLLWSYLSHKVLRWLMPLPMLGAFVTSAASAGGGGFYAVALAAQVSFYAVAVLHWARVPGLVRARASAIPYYFCLVNGAALAGLCRAVARPQAATWSRATRS